MIKISKIFLSYCLFFCFSKASKDGHFKPNTEIPVMRISVNEMEGGRLKEVLSGILLNAL